MQQTQQNRSPIAQAFEPMRNALRPQGSENITLLRLNPGCAVDADLVQKAIDEIIRAHTIDIPMGEPETACMQLAKILLADSAYLDFSQPDRI